MSFFVARFFRISCPPFLPISFSFPFSLSLSFSYSLSVRLFVDLFSHTTFFVWLSQPVYAHLFFSLVANPFARWKTIFNVKFVNRNNKSISENEEKRRNKKNNPLSKFSVVGVFAYTQLCVSVYELWKTRGEHSMMWVYEYVSARAYVCVCIWKIFIRWNVFTFRTQSVWWSKTNQTKTLTIKLWYAEWIISICEVF